MNSWSLPKLLASLHDDIQRRLQTARDNFGHPGTKGEASESVWRELLEKYLPKRYSTTTAHIVDCKGQFSQQIDVVIFDRQYSPFIFHFQGQTIIPAESVYAVFEAKQSINAKQVAYAMDKVKSVRSLERTSLPIPYAKDVYPAKPLIPIYGGILTFESDWTPPMGDAFIKSLERSNQNDHLDIGCVATHGYFNRNIENGVVDVYEEGKPATGFLFKLISLLQFSGTVPMIDIQAYAQWLNK